jgi:cytochrome c2
MASFKPKVTEFKDVYDRLTKEKTDLLDPLEKLGTEKRRLEKELSDLRKPVEDLQRRLEAARKRPTKIRQIHIPELDVVDRCESCHLGVRDPLLVDAVQPFTSHPNVFSLWREDPGGFSWKGILDVHPPERFGCTSCHRGQGYATTSPEKAHGDVEFWPHAMLRGEFVQASCLKCHQDLERLPGAELLAHGQRLFDRYACHNCHIAKGYEDSRKVAPSLAIIGSKVNRQWLVPWIKKPKDYLPETVMPDFLLSDDEVQHMADFLMTLRGEQEPPRPSSGPTGRKRRSRILGTMSSMRSTP